MSQTRLTRSSTDKIIAGVCGGLAEYLEIDPVLVRLAFLVLFFASGIGFPIYIILWIVMP
ncbi:MAG: PspC domain-containing protein, partial [Candidatus Promineifilaceae bacterium]